MTSTSCWNGQCTVAHRTIDGKHPSPRRCTGRSTQVRGCMSDILRSVARQCRTRPRGLRPPPPTKPSRRRPRGSTGPGPWLLAMCPRALFSSQPEACHGPVGTSQDPYGPKRSDAYARRTGGGPSRIARSRPRSLPNWRTRMSSWESPDVAPISDSTPALSSWRVGMTARGGGSALSAVAVPSMRARRRGVPQVSSGALGTPASRRPAPRERVPP